VQLLAKLRWSDKTTVTVKPEPNLAYINYDPSDAQSVAFGASGTDSAIDATTRWVAHHFPRMLAANFQGTAGQEAVRGAALSDLQRLARKFATHPFSSSTEVGA
jgi:hypothetical protein